MSCYSISVTGRGKNRSFLSCSTIRKGDMGKLDGDGVGIAERRVEILGRAVCADSELQSRMNHDEMIVVKEEKVDSFECVSASSDALDSKVEVTRLITGKAATSGGSIFTEAGYLEVVCGCSSVIAGSAKELENGDNAGEDYKDASVKKDNVLELAIIEVHSDSFLVRQKRNFLEVAEDSAATTVISGRSGEEKVDSLALSSASEKKDEVLEAKKSRNHYRNLAIIVRKDYSMEVSTSDNIVNNEKHLVIASPSKASRGKLAVPRTSIYHGVTRHRWSGKYEAHLWDNTCRLEGRRRKGKQVYLGSYDTEEKAARSYDIAALKYWGADTKLNFPVSQYAKELDDIRDMSREECVTYLRRRSSCFSRGASAYRGVTRRQRDGRWQARIGRVAGNKDIYLGTFKTEEEAAEAYDIAAIELRGLNAITNFDISNYCEKGLALSPLEEEQEEEAIK